MSFLDMLPGIIALLISLYLLYLNYYANKSIISVTNGSTVVTNPASLTFSSPQNTVVTGCTLVDSILYEDSGTKCRCFLKVSVVPSYTNTTTSVAFSLPQKTTNFTSSDPLIAAGQPLIMYNGQYVCGQTSVVSVAGTTTAVMSFTSSGTTAHVMDCMVVYSV